MNEIELYSKINDPVDAIERLGKFFAQSGMFGCDRPEQGMVLAMACLVERRSPIEIKRRYHLQNGDLSMRADAMLAEFRTIKSGKHKIIERTAERAAVELTLDGDTQLFAFTWKEALNEPFVFTRDGKTLKKNYATPRARTQMLWARVISEGVHAMAPEIVSGVYTPEELDDPAEKPLLPERETATKAEPKAAKVTKVETAKPAETPPAESQPAHEEQGSTSPAEPRKEINWVNPRDKNKVSAEGAAALQERIGEANAESAMRWFEKNKWIAPAGSLLDLSPARAQNVYKDVDKFLAHIKKG